MIGKAPGKPEPEGLARFGKPGLPACVPEEEVHPEIGGSAIEPLAKGADDAAASARQRRTALFRRCDRCLGAGNFHGCGSDTKTTLTEHAGPPLPGPPADEQLWRQRAPSTPACRDRRST